MASEYDFPPRASSNGPMSATRLEDKFELLKEIGDGSFGSVALARVRTAGAHIARRGTLVGLDCGMLLMFKADFSFRWPSKR